MKIDKIYFDLDGVLADFEEKKTEIGFILDKNGDRIKEDDRMWEMIKPIEHFYLNLKPMKESVDLFKKILEKYGEEKVEILSGIPKPCRGILNATDDKIEWAKKYLSNNIKINIVLRADKSKYCKGKGSILIDDNKENCLDWEKHGGTSILFNVCSECFRKIYCMLDIKL